MSGLYGVNGYLVLQPVELEPEAEAELVQLPMNVPVTHKNKITVLTIRQNVPAPALITVSYTLFNIVNSYFFDRQCQLRS